MKLQLRIHDELARWAGRSAARVVARFAIRAQARRAAKRRLSMTPPLEAGRQTPRRPPQ